MRGDVDSPVPRWGVGGWHLETGALPRFPSGHALARKPLRRLRRPISANNAEIDRFWEALAREKLNDRQHAMLNRLLDGFEGKLTSSKWAIITKASQDTASRDINDLVDRGILRKDDAGGRSTSYSLSQ